MTYMGGIGPYEEWMDNEEYAPAAIHETEVSGIEPKDKPPPCKSCWATAITDGKCEQCGRPQDVDDYEWLISLFMCPNCQEQLDEGFCDTCGSTRKELAA